MTGVVEEAEDAKEALLVNDGSKDPPGKLMENETSEKMDSGMDDEMTGTSPDVADLNSDSEDEPMVIKKKNKKHLIIDDDDEDSKSTNGDADASEDVEDVEAESNAKTTNIKDTKKKTISEALSSIMDSDSDSDEDAQSKSSVKGEENNASGEESDSSTDVVKKTKANKEAVESENENEDSQQDASQKKKNIFDSDLFDAEDSDSDTGATPRDGDSGRSSDEDNNADDEGFDEDNLDPKLKAKLLKMKGAAKKPRQGKDRKAKPKRDELLDIHSESQRLVRESQVLLPYHQPTPKSLNDFLARATKKQQDYKALKGLRDFKKPSVIQHVIANCSPAVTPSSQPHHSDTDATPTPICATPTSDSVSEAQDGSTQQDALSKKMDFEEDELPDLDENSHKNNDTMNKDELIKPEESVTESVNEQMDVDSGHNVTSEVTVENVPRENSCPESHTDIELDGVTNDSKQTNSECVPPEIPGDDKECSTTDKEQKAADSAVNLAMTPKLQVLSSLKSETPKLSGGPDSFINLDGDDDVEPVFTGKDKLLNRFMEHSKNKQHKHAKDVDISIVEKASVSDDMTELKLTSITYHVAEEEDNKLQKLDKPGAKLLALKQQLQSKMKVKREESRQKRQEIYALENEEGFEGGTDTEEERILDNDDEMSEKSDTDIEDDQFDAEFGEEEFEEEDEVEEREANPFLDGEAEEDDDDYNPDKDVNAGRADDDIEDSEEDGGDTMKLKLDTSDDDDADDDLENLSQNVRSSSKKKRKHVRQLTISDDEDSNLSSAQANRQESNTGSFKVPTGVSPKDNLEEDDDLMSPLTKHLTATQTQKPKKTSSMSLPIEDSQDLYGTAAEPFTSSTYPASDVQPSQGLNFLMEDSQSQMLDADGFFKVKSTTKKPSQAPLGLKDICSTQDNMAEFMGLCSGKFVESQDDSKKTSCKQLFGNNADSAPDASQGGMDDLLALCSGVFPGATTQGKSQGRKRKLEEDEESNTSFTLLSDNEAQMDSDKDELADDDENPPEDFDEVDGDVPKKPQVQKSFRGFRGKITGKMRREFIEDEAELSGSEAESDEDLDVPEDEDIMEMELGDQDVAMTEDELRNQVGRAHLKETIDADKRDILRLQEMYLPDGDLYTEGGGRMRRFRWKNMDDESQQDMFGGAGSDEDVPEEDADELKWRMERFEREKFLQEEREKEENENANSQFFQLGKKFALKIKDPVKKLPEKESVKPQATKKAVPSPAKPVLKPSNQRKGSFLTRGKEALAKIAERTKSGVNPNATRHSKNFVFQVVSPEKSEATLQSKPISRPAVHKRPSNLPPAKRQRTKTLESKSSSSSIFNLLER